LRRYDQSDAGHTPAYAINSFTRIIRRDPLRSWL
jgi:hypothetical protein